MKLQKKINSPIGAIYLAASDAGLNYIYWDPLNIPMLSEKTKDSKAAKIIEKTEKQLSEYFSGKRTQFDLPLSIKGTEFQKRVWQQLSQIPFGVTMSYKDIALKLNDGKASRAVGTANGRNPISIVIPCHRVIASDGTLGGYAGGLKVKVKLLTLEKASFKSSPQK